MKAILLFLFFLVLTCFSYSEGLHVSEAIRVEKTFLGSGKSKIDGSKERWHITISILSSYG